MAIKLTKATLISTAIVAAFGIGYLIYFDSKRRNDPHFKKQLKQNRKNATKEKEKEKEKKKEIKEKPLETIETLIQSVLTAVAVEDFPESPEAKETYFNQQVELGDQLNSQGKPDESIVHYYKALRIYPSPLELITMYQSNLPEQSFRIIVSIMALEQQQRQDEFYNHFPPAETHLKLSQLDRETEELMHALVADKDFNAGDVLYTEPPLISALHTQMERTHCNFCMKKLAVEEEKIECKNCTQVAFCSEACSNSGSQQYHHFLCTNNRLEDLDAKINKETEFYDYIHEKHLSYPQMIAQFLAGMVAEDMEKRRLGKQAPKYSAWDYIERFKSSKVKPSKENENEAQMIKNALAVKVPGIEEFLSDEIYLILKEKLYENSYEVFTLDEDASIAVEKSDEPVHVLNKEQTPLGVSLYNISSYIRKPVCDEDVNVKISFKDNTNTIVVTASKNIKKGDEIQAMYN